MTQFQCSNIVLILKYSPDAQTSTYSMIFYHILSHSTIPDTIFGTKWSNPVKLDRKRKVWYLFLGVFQLLFAKSKFLKGG